MNKEKIKLALFFIIGLLTAFLVMYFIQNYKIEKKNRKHIGSAVSINENNSENFKQNESSK